MTRGNRTKITQQIGEPLEHVVRPASSSLGRAKRKWSAHVGEGAPRKIGPRGNQVARKCPLKKL